MGIFIKPLSKQLGKLLVRQGKTLSTAESCTGGMIAKIITDVPGSSKYFAGGVVSYSNEAKIKGLGVDGNLIERHGAVSEEVAYAMLKGIQSLMHTDCGIAVTGVAGPGGGTPSKPVGTVYIAVANAGKTIVRKFIFHKDRENNRRLAANAALKLLVNMLSGV